MSQPHVMNAQEKALAAIFYEALKPHISGLSPEDVTAQEFTWSCRIDPQTMDSIRFFNPTALCHPRKEVIVRYPKQGFKLAQALQKASMTLTNHWVAFSANRVEIKADLNTATSYIPNHEILGDYLQEALACGEPG